MCIRIVLLLLTFAATATLTAAQSINDSDDGVLFVTSSAVGSTPPYPGTRSGWPLLPLSPLALLALTVATAACAFAYARAARDAFEVPAEPELPAGIAPMITVVSTDAIRVKPPKPSVHELKLTSPHDLKPTRRYNVHNKDQGGSRGSGDCEDGGCTNDDCTCCNSNINNGINDNDDMQYNTGDYTHSGTSSHAHANGRGTSHTGAGTRSCESGTHAHGVLTVTLAPSLTVASLASLGAFAPPSLTAASLPLLASLPQVASLPHPASLRLETSREPSQAGQSLAQQLQQLAQPPQRLAQPPRPLVQPQIHLAQPPSQPPRPPAALAAPGLDAAPSLGLSGPFLGLLMLPAPDLSAASGPNNHSHVYAHSIKRSNNAETHALEPAHDNSSFTHVRVQNEHTDMQ